MENLLKLSQFSNGELTKLRRRQQHQRQKAIVLVSKKTTLHVHHAFLYIPLPSLHDYHVNDQILLLLLFFFFFLEDGNGKAINFIISAWTRVRPLSSAPIKIPFFQATG